MTRLDLEIVNRGLTKSRKIAQDLIESGDVFLNDTVCLKASKNILDSDNIKVQNLPKFVSRGGLKLEAALLHFGISSLKNKNVLDIGSSTGGFTDCAIKFGAEKVLAVDIGTMQFDESLRANKKIELYENTDIRSFQIKEKVDLIVMDVSFISLTHIIKILDNFLKEGGSVISLIKPQFEVGKGNLDKKGLVKNSSMYEEVLSKIKKEFEDNSFKVIEVIDSPILGGDGNKEFLIYVKK